MQNAIYNIIHDMSQCLSMSDLKELQRVLIKYLVDEEHIKKNTTSNKDYLRLFVESKSVEGLSKETLHYYEKGIEEFLRYINVPLAQVTTEHIRDYLAQYPHRHQCSRATLDLHRRYLSTFFSWLYEEDYIIRNPIKRVHKIKSEQKLKTVLSDEDVEVLRDSCKNLRNHAIVDLLYSSGMRVGEIRLLNIDDIDFEKKECVIFGKGSKERTAYFDARTKIHLKKYLESRTDTNEALFVSVKKPHQRLERNTYETILREMGKELGINKVHPHKFRRSMATKAIDKGMPIEQVQRILGHSEINTTMTYAMVNQNNVKQSYHKLFS